MRFKIIFMIFPSIRLDSWWKDHKNDLKSMAGALATFPKVSLGKFRKRPWPEHTWQTKSQCIKLL